MRTITQLFVGLSLALLPLTPAAAFAGTSASVGVSVGASTSGATAEGTADLEMHPVVVTHESATADANADENAAFNRETTGNATSSAAILSAHAKQLARKDENIDAVVISDDNVTVSYREPAKLFGFITVHVPVRVSVDADGTTEVSYPWYHFLMATGQTSIAVRAKAIANEHASAKATAEASFSSDNAIRVVDALAAMLKSEAEASVNTDAETQ